MSSQNTQKWEAVNFRIEPAKKQRIEEIARENHRDLTGHMRFLVDQCIADNPVKKQRKAKSTNEVA